MTRPNKKILLAGGGSGGPVAPLLAVAAELGKLHPGTEFLFVGTRRGPEREMVEQAGLAFASIPAAKFRRYFSLANFTDIFVFIYSLFAAYRIVRKFQPDMVFGAGGFVAVPLCWMAWLQGRKIGLHQQDARVGLSNRLISPVANLITTAFERTAKQFYSGSGLGKQTLRPAAEWVGNPVRLEFFTPPSPDARQKLGLDGSLPVLLITGGAGGAAQINQVAEQCMGELLKSHQVIHVTGHGKQVNVQPDPHFHQHEFLNPGMADAMKVADIVIARAGVSTISELSALGKIAIIVPMPDTHQEDNAAVLKEKSAAVVLNRTEFTPADLPRIVSSLKFNVARQELLKENMSKLMPHHAAPRIAELISQHVK